VKIASNRLWFGLLELMVYSYLIKKFPPSYEHEL
jgi:hypothetical protein